MMPFGRKAKQIANEKPTVNMENAALESGAPLFDLKLNGRSRAAQTHKSSIYRSNRGYVLALFGVIIICMLVVMTLGVKVYKSLDDSRKKSQIIRLETQIVANDIRRVNENGSISRANGPEGSALVLSEHLASGDFETRLYLHDGVLVHEYAVAGEPIQPEKATPIVETSRFEWSIAKNGLLTITTDSGETYLALRSSSPLQEGE